jgi:hypothetical protein
MTGALLPWPATAPATCEMPGLQIRKQRVCTVLDGGLTVAWGWLRWVARADGSVRVADVRSELLSGAWARVRLAPRTVHCCRLPRAAQGAGRQYSCAGPVVCCLPAVLAAVAAPPAPGVTASSGTSTTLGACGSARTPALAHSCHFNVLCLSMCRAPAPLASCPRQRGPDFPVSPVVTALWRAAGRRREASCARPCCGPARGAQLAAHAGAGLRCRAHVRQRGCVVCRPRRAPPRGAVPPLSCELKDPPPDALTSDTCFRTQPVQVPVRPRACPWSGQQQQTYMRWPRRQVFMRPWLCTWKSGTPPEQLLWPCLPRHYLGAAVKFTA